MFDGQKFIILLGVTSGKKAYFNTRSAKAVNLTAADF